MMARYQALAQRIRTEMEDLERTQAIVQRHWHSARSASGDPDAYLNSVALNLHAWYSGLERVFELIALELDGGALGGEAWHTELLRQMALDLPNVRPPVIQRETAMHLDEYRKFRHRIRNIYATSLDPDRMRALVEALPTLWASVHQEIATFSEFLDSLASTGKE